MTSQIVLLKIRKMNFDAAFYIHCEPGELSLPCLIVSKRDGTIERDPCRRLGHWKLCSRFHLKYPYLFYLQPTLYIEIAGTEACRVSFLFILIC